MPQQNRHRRGDCRGTRLGLVYADLATRDPAELAGLPWTKDSRSIRCRPDWLPREGQGLLFLDELPQAGVANLNIAATLIADTVSASMRSPQAGWWSALATTRTTALG